MHDPGSCPGPRVDALLALLRAADAVWDGSRRFFRRWRVGPSQFNVLNLLHHRAAGLRPTELGRQLIMHRSNVTGLVDRLAARGLLRREPIPGDRRAQRVVLTPRGRRLVESILPHYYRAAEKVCAGVPSPRVASLRADLEAIAAQAIRQSGNLSALQPPDPSKTRITTRKP
ncbi:MAG TPA: MarR family transcriptional regulator [Candidatus Paceibacterota bacterium]|nr:MarR family transcriptional regulator [Verrucomicrobiota bacterium]HOX01381.1 MarR family transcriptional regulator [Verrucomicrobiota bacterium]HRZ44098.1 MarR family transcriptional regulator [Candidatus Paceibacterota bacterium]HRZ94715.1 MarR family transcriptional regulator [Candidatus Paceibacterota bacterium]